MSNWLTPEEMARKKALRKKLMYVAIPVIGACIGALFTILANSL